mmetsp:Transcript_13666/g.16435  ORF Transcript_13666/g.16435 Transcript_13666/m.16435 type:complete len:212 (-) Transcript_13666:495-1130(-)
MTASYCTLCFTFSSSSARRVSSLNVPSAAASFKLASTASTRDSIAATVDVRADTSSDSDALTSEIAVSIPSVLCRLMRWIASSLSLVSCASPSTSAPLISYTAFSLSPASCASPASVDSFIAHICSSSLLSTTSTLALRSSASLSNAIIRSPPICDISARISPTADDTSAPVLSILSSRVAASTSSASFVSAAICDILLLISASTSAILCS